MFMLMKLSNRFCLFCESKGWDPRLVLSYMIDPMNDDYSIFDTAKAGNQLLQIQCEEHIPHPFDSDDSINWADLVKVLKESPKAVPRTNKGVLIISDIDDLIVERLIKRVVKYFACTRDEAILKVVEATKDYYSNVIFSTAQPVTLSDFLSKYCFSHTIK